MFPTGGNLLAAHLGSRRNSLDLLRLIAASLVILGHSHAVLGSGVDPMAAWNGSVYSGLFALHVFFFISGMLVTNSFLHQPDTVRWLVSRALRIVPALFVCLVFSVFVLGPLITALTPKQYLTDGQTWDYFLGNFLLLRTRFLLPGVFAGNIDKAVNGPLWSLYLEVRLYLLAGVLLWIFRGRRREWLTAALGILAIVGLVAPRWISVFGETENNLACSGLFLLGALCALWSDKVLISNIWLVVLFLAANKYVWTAAFAPLFFFFTCYLVLCFGFSRFLSAIHLPGDYSYGLYIYGWPVQQVIAQRFPNWSPPLNAASSLVCALGLAALSWHLVEKPSLAQKKRASQASGPRLKKLVPIAVGCALAILIGGGLYDPKPVNAREVPGQLRTIQAFGPTTIVAGKPFNIQPGGSSAMWVRLPSPAGAGNSIVFRNHKLKTVAVGDLLTATVPAELFANPGEAEIYVVDENSTPPRRTPSIRLTVLSPPP